MNKPMYFYPYDADECLPMDIQKDIMKSDGVTTRTMYKAKAIPTHVVAYCKEFDEVIAKDHPFILFDGCGKSCDGYEPRNGKSGRCKHHSHCYEPGEEVVITIAP